MSDISQWSNTANNNNTSAPDGFPEGMNPSGVNNAAREVMAAVRRQHENAQWIDLGNTPTYSSATVFLISGDVTTDYEVGRRVKIEDATTLYGVISASTYSSPNTSVTVTLDSGSLSVSISSVSLGILSRSNSALQQIEYNTIPDLLAGRRSGTFTLYGYREKGDTEPRNGYWDATQDKANHNGGTIIDPDVTFPSDWTNQTQVAAWFTAGTGTGCCVFNDDKITDKIFGGFVNVSTPSTLQIQAAIDYADSVGGPVWLSAGSIVTGTLHMKGSVLLIGKGWYAGSLDDGTELYLESGTNASHIILDDAVSRYAGVANLSMNGNYTNQSGTSYGIEIDRQSGDGFTQGDSFIFKDLWVKNYLTDGVLTIGFCNGTLFQRVYSNYNQGRGFRNSAGDVHYVACEAFSNELQGFHDDGYGTMYTNTKAWFNGSNGNPTGATRYQGFYLAGPGGYTMAGCVSQENHGHGLELSSTKGCNIQCLVDGNSITYTEGNMGVTSDRSYDGIKLTNADNNVLNITCAQFQVDIDPAYKCQRYGVNIDANSVGNVINATTDNHDITATTGPYKYDALTSAASNNTVIIDGKVLTMPDESTTVSSVSTSTDKNYGITLLDGSSAFTQVTIGAGRVPSAGIRKTFRTVDATNACQIVVNDYIHGVLTVPMSTVGDIVRIVSDGSVWIMDYASVSGRIHTATSSRLASITDNINTSDKFKGKRVFNETTNTDVVAVGSAAGDVWVAGGSTAHTPV